MKHYLFTYGMLTNRDIMSPGAKLIGVGLLKGWAFEMLTFANVFQRFNSTAQGVLWEINDLILEECDWREGYPTTYDRKLVTVKCGNRNYPAWVYTLTERGRTRYRQNPTSYDYYQSVAEGYEQHGVNLEQIIRVGRLDPVA